MPQPPEDLRLVLEPPHRAARGGAVAHHLQGDGPARVVLHGFVDGSHPARGDRSLDLIATDVLAWGRRPRCHQGFVHDLGRHVVVGEQRLDLGPQCRIAAALLGEQGAALVGWGVDRRQKELAGLLGAIRGHRG
jgi:hypothetical protein